MSDAINVLLRGVCFLVLGLVFCLGPVAAQPAPPEVEPVGPRHFVGAWKTTEIAVTTPDSSWTIEQPAGLYMFTLYFYSATSLWGERPLFTEETTDAERLAAYASLKAHAGVFFLLRGTEGAAGTTGEMEMRPFVAKEPHLMAEGQALLLSFRVTKDTLWLQHESEGTTVATTLRRVERPFYK